MGAGGRVGAMRAVLLQIFAAAVLLLAPGGAPAQDFFKGEIVSLTPADYLAGAQTTGRLRMRNTGVSAFFAAQALEVPSGWTVTPAFTNQVLVRNGDAHNFSFQITAPATATAPVNIKFALVVYVDDVFPVYADEETFQIRSVALPGMFELTSPPAGAFNIAMPITFQWEASSGAVSYRFELYEEQGGGAAPTPFFVRQDLETNSTTVTEADAPLPPGTDFFWRVIAINTVGQRINTGGLQVFRTMPEPPLGIFHFIVPAEDGMRLSTTPSFSWEPSDNAIQYLLEVFPDVNGMPMPPAVRAVELTTTSYAWTGEPLAPGNYHVLVAAFNRTGGLQVSGGPRPFIATALSAFTQQTPAPGANGVSDEPAFLWTQSANATAYRLELSLLTTSGPQPAATITTPNAAVSHQWTGTPLVRGATYEWMVTALGPTEERPSTNGPLQFTVRPVGTFSVLHPVGGDTGVSVSPVFEWQPAPSAVSYKVEFTPSDGGAPDLGSISSPPELTVTGTSAALTSMALAPAKDYFWRVTASGAGGAPTQTNREGWVPFRTAELAGFNLLSPANGAMGVSLQPVLMWEAVPRAEKYRVHLSAAGTGSLPLFETTGNTPSIALGLGAKLNGETMYTWTVEAVRAGEVRFAAQPFQFTTTSRPAAVYQDIVDAIVGRQILSVPERAALGIGADERIDVSTLMPVP